MTFGERTTPMRRGDKPLRANPETTRAWQRRTRRPLPARSERREADRPTRAAFVVDVLARRWACEAQLSWCCTGPSAEVNELQRGTHREDCWLADDKVTSLCPECHRWITLHPDWAYRHGHQLGHEAGDGDFALAEVLRGRMPGVVCLPECAIDHREAA